MMIRWGLLLYIPAKFSSKCHPYLTNYGENRSCFLYPSWMGYAFNNKLWSDTYIYQLWASIQIGSYRINSSYIIDKFLQPRKFVKK